MKEAAPYSSRQDENEEKWIRETITSALSGSEHVFEDFERQMFAARQRCHAKASPPEIADRVQSLRNQLLEKILEAGHSRVLEEFDRTDDPRKLRRFLEQDLHRMLRVQSGVIVRHQWLPLLELISLSLYKNLRIFPYCVQVCGALKMLQGKAIEMLTGEGKTFVGPLVAIPLALKNLLAREVLEKLVRTTEYVRTLGLHEGEIRPQRLGSVHMITSDSYLVLRDYTKLKSVYSDLGITTAYILDGMPRFERALAYDADVIFGTASRFAWDHIESSFVEPGSTAAPRPSPVAIIDELDHGLIDEASTNFRIGTSNSVDPSTRVVVYQTHQFYNELASTASHFLEFDSSHKMLDCTELGLRMLRGLYRTTHSTIVAWIFKTSLLDAWRQFLDTFLKSIVTIEDLTDRGSIVVLTKSTSNAFIYYDRESGRLETDVKAPCVEALATELIATLPARALEFALLLADAGELAISWPSRSKGPQKTSGLARRSENDTWVREILIDKCRRLLAAGVRRAVANAESRRQVRDEMKALLSAFEEPVPNNDLSDLPLIDPLVHLTRSLLIHPMYEIFVEEYVAPEKMSDFLRDLGDIVDLVTRDPSTLFSQWLKEIPARYIHLNKSEELSLTEAGIHRLTDFLGTFSLDENASEQSKKARLQILTENKKAFFKFYSRSFMGYVQSLQSGWAELQETEKVDTKFLQKMSAYLSDAKSCFKGLAHAGLGPPDIQKAETLTASASELLDLMGKPDLPKKLVDDIAGVGMTILTMTVLRHLTFTDDSQSIREPLGLFMRLAGHTRLATNATMDVLFVGFVLCLVSGRPTKQIFDNDESPATLGDRALARAASFELLFPIVGATSHQIPPLLTFKSLDIRAEMQLQLSEGWDLMRNYLRILILGKPVGSDSMFISSWLHQAMYGYLDDLRPLGLLKSYDANLARQVLRMCFESEAIVDGSDYLLREIMGPPDKRRIDPYQKAPEETEVAIINRATGRIEINSRWPGQLHEVLEAKHNLLVKTGGSLRSISMQSLATDVYELIVGMSGTLTEVAAELLELYGIESEAVPPQLPSIRVDHADVCFRTEEEARGALLDLVEEIAAQSRPILVRCLTIQQSEITHRAISERLARKDIELLNGRPTNASRESRIIARAGKVGSIVVSTQMVGRGVDIRLEDSNKGLFAIGLERQIFRRWDRQFSGRAGRQGDHGDSRFICSMERSATDGGNKRLVQYSLEEDKMPQNIRAIQRRRERLARKTIQERKAIDSSIQEGNKMFQSMYQSRAENLHRCNVCRDHYIENFKTAGICSRCTHCLGKIRRSGTACSDSFCVSEDAPNDYYRRTSAGDSCYWNNIHTSFIHSDNPTLLPAEHSEAIRAVHEDVLQQVSDWPSYIAANSVLQDVESSQVDRFFVQHCCEALFETQVAPDEFHLIERRAGLPGSQPLQAQLEDHLRDSIEDLVPDPEACPWLLLLPPGIHASLLPSEGNATSRPTHLTCRQLQSFLSRHLYGGTAVEESDGRLVADKLDFDRCTAVDFIVRKVGSYFADESWDEWYLRLEELGSAREKAWYQSTQERLGDFRVHAIETARRYILIAQIRSIHALLSICKLNQLEDRSSKRTEVARILKPIASALEMSLPSITLQMSTSENPLDSFVRAVMCVPEDHDHDLALALKNTGEPLRSA